MNAPQVSLNRYVNGGDGLSDVAMAKLVFTLAAESMSDYTGAQPLEATMQYLESLVGVESKAVKALRQQFAGSLSQEAKTS
jgi:hypothetical protein